MLYQSKSFEPVDRLDIPAACGIHMKHVVAETFGDQDQVELVVKERRDQSDARDS